MCLLCAAQDVGVDVQSGPSSSSQLQHYAMLLLIGVLGFLALRKLKDLAFRGTFYPSKHIEVVNRLCLMLPAYETRKPHKHLPCGERLDEQFMSLKSRALAGCYNYWQWSPCKRGALTCELQHCWLRW